MTKTRINGFVGVRISRSMYNDSTWKKSNHFGAVMTAVGYICAVSVVTIIYAHKVV